jgi:tryptophanyl-tRNA synthetase
MSKRVVSGQRPTGKLHLGHLHGTLNNWVELQKNYECFYFVADWHALTTGYEDVSLLKENTYDMVLDWLAVGLDPEKSVIYRQSDVPDIAELYLYYSMIATLGALYRVPTYKEQLREIKGRELKTYGFLGYPVLQAADIAIMHGDFVPVGEDQVSHLEFARELIRKFNGLYGKMFPEPKALLTKTPRILGTDGRKMSKSYNNAIYLADSAETIKEKVGKMVTDPQRVRKTDPGDPKSCSVFDLHAIYEKQDLEDIKKQCRQALRGCVECKNILAKSVVESLIEFQERRSSYLRNPLLVKEILEAGANRARPVTRETLDNVRQKMNLLFDMGLK